jgi:hypothetical protein
VKKILRSLQSHWSFSAHRGFRHAGTDVNLPFELQDMIWEISLSRRPWMEKPLAQSNLRLLCCYRARCADELKKFQGLLLILPS